MKKMKEIDKSVIGNKYVDHQLNSNIEQYLNYVEKSNQIILDLTMNYKNESPLALLSNRSPLNTVLETDHGNMEESFNIQILNQLSSSNRNTRVSSPKKAPTPVFNKRHTVIDKYLL